MYGISIDTEDVAGILADASGDTLAFDEAPDVGLTFPGQDGDATWRCTECSETTDEKNYAGGNVDPESLCTGTECEACEGWGNVMPDGTPDNQGVNTSTACATCDGSGHGAHNWLTEPHAWLNSAGIHVREDTVTVSLSLGDPRGAFTMSVERLTYTPEGSDTEVTELRLSVPTPADTMAHMGLVPLGSPGYYRIVSSESPAHVAAREAVRAAESDVEYAAKARKAIAMLSERADRANQQDSAAHRNEARALAMAQFLDTMGA